MTYQRPTFESDPWAEAVRKEYQHMTEVCRTCGEYQHPRFEDCRICHGTGHVIGGDDLRPCSTCKLRPTTSPFVRRAMAGELLAKVVA